MKDIILLNKSDILKNMEIKKNVTKIKDGTLQVKSLSYFQKKMVEIYLETENYEKRIELQRKKNLILYNKLKNLNSNSKAEILNKISPKDKEAYFKFLNNMNKKNS